MAAKLNNTFISLITLFLILTPAAPLNTTTISAGPTFNRGQWLRAAILGANNGALSTAALTIGVGPIDFQEPKKTIIIGISLLLAGALGIGGGEFVSVHAQYDIELSELLRENISREELGAKERDLPSPFWAAAASAASYAVGAAVPLAAVFVPRYYVRMGVVVGIVSVELAGVGWLAAVVGRSTSRFLAVLRIVGGGWLGMGVSFLVVKVIKRVGTTQVSAV